MLNAPRCTALFLIHAALAGAAGAESEWSPFWSRDADAGSARSVSEAPGGRPPVLHVEHRGAQDWCVNRDERTAVKEGDVLRLSVRVRARGEGTVSVCATTYRADGTVQAWTLGANPARGSDAWQKLEARIIVPPGVNALRPRLAGNGPIEAWFDSFELHAAGNLLELQQRNGVSARLHMSNASIRVTFDTRNACLTVLDRRTDRAWHQLPSTSAFFITHAAARAGEEISFGWMSSHPALEGTAVLALARGAPELVLTLQAEGDMAEPLRYPPPFASAASQYLVVPMNEGISYPVEDAAIEPMRLIAYGGHGICMAFWGATDGEAGYLGLIETADDAALRIQRLQGCLTAGPEWEPQRGAFGYPRRLRYVFFNQGGHVAMCKRYRAHVEQQGRLKTLAQKRVENPDADLLVGAANVWNWDSEPLALVHEMQAAGISRILWSRRTESGTIAALNALPGVLSSRYDIVQDIMDPEVFPRLRHVHPDWPTEAWPDDLMQARQGDWVRGWRVRTREGDMVPCGVLCDRQAPRYLDRRIAEELKTHAYRSRFIDTTTAAPWRECYHSAHPMTRSDSRVAKMQLLELVSGKYGLVCGSETGHDAAVPYVHYFEGMMSLGPYRIPDAGRDMVRIWDEVPERVATFQLGHRYRLPLWELVYHDCVVAQWYWGDYNNKLPALWDRRDLFNALYGTPPMFMFRYAWWKAHRDRFLRSYQTTAPIARATAYHEMTDHRFLTPGRDVQQTRFANGVAVTVNFGDRPFRLADGTEVGPLGVHATGVIGHR